MCTPARSPVPRLDGQVRMQPKWGFHMNSWFLALKRLSIYKQERMNVQKLFSALRLQDIHQCSLAASVAQQQPQHSEQLFQPHKPPPNGKNGHQQGAFKALLLAVRLAKFKCYTFRCHYLLGSQILIHVKLAYLLGSGKGLVKLKLISRLEVENSIQPKNLSPALPRYIQEISPPPQSVSKLQRTMQNFFKIQLRHLIKGGTTSNKHILDYTATRLFAKTPVLEPSQLWISSGCSQRSRLQNTTMENSRGGLKTVFSDLTRESCAI